MINKQTRSLLAAAFALVMLSSCTAYHRTIADSNSRVNFTSKDWTITAPYGGQATVTKILGIDFRRLFTTRTGGAGVSTSIPIIGSFVKMNTADDYAMYDLLQRHSGFDAIFYPQFKRKTFNLLYIYTRSTSEVKARLGKLNTGSGGGDAEDGDK